MNRMPTGDQPALEYVDTRQNAVAYLAELISEEPTVRTLVSTWIDAPAPLGIVELDAMASEDEGFPLPGVVCAPLPPATSGVIGSGRDGQLTLDRSLVVGLQVVVDAASNPGDILRIWGAIEAALVRDYRKRLPQLWKRGISAIRVLQSPAPERPDHESNWVVASAAIEIEI